MNIESGTTLRNLIRFRPLAVETLEEYAGYRVWRQLDDSLEAFSESLGINLAAVLLQLGRLPPGPDHANWDEIPLYRLVDHLTAEHREFRERSMQEIRHLLYRHDVPPYPGGYLLKAIYQEFHVFEKSFLWHMTEEEDFLFPKILRIEACIRHPGLYPEIFKGTVGSYPLSELHAPEAGFRRMLVDVREKVRVKDPAAESAARGIEALLETLDSRIAAHARLEIDVLLPRALGLERELAARNSHGRLSALMGAQR